MTIMQTKSQRLYTGLKTLGEFRLKKRKPLEMSQICCHGTNYASQKEPFLGQMISTTHLQMVGTVVNHKSYKTCKSQCDSCQEASLLLSNTQSFVKPSFFRQGRVSTCQNKTCRFQSILVLTSCLIAFYFKQQQKLFYPPDLYLTKDLGNAID
ncbi:Hypothetical_protein [Hexamita inflata]|uniref:Hypothetical_protein n=1 Tax=Hexamita inflata TaxID=28002 RepID=A0AA86TZD3_9EUKA|nr:Hypothetical protein HINF_LOCUS23400 [Hexamita inflata]